MRREDYEKAFNLDKLVESMRFFDQLLGKEWIHQQTKERDKKHKGDKYYFLCEEESEHPIIRNWPLMSKEYYEKASQERKIYPIQQLGLIAPAHYIRNAVGIIKGFNDRVSKTDLRDPIGFESFVFECKIASVFHRLGYNIEFLPEKDEPTPDFLIRCSKGDVFIECKKKIFTKKEKDYRIKVCEIAKGILYLMDEMQQNLFVEIYSKILSGLDSADITTNLKRQMQRDLNSGDFSIDRTKIKWHGLLPFNVEKHGAFGVSLGKEPNYLVNMTEVFVNGHGEMKYRNPRAIAFFTDVKFDRVKPLASRFSSNDRKDALRQIEKYSPSLVYLEVEKGTKIQDLQEAERQIKEIFNPSTQRYDKRTKGIRYCVFSVIELVEEKGMIGEYTASRVIENKHSEVSLPQSFFMLGKWFPGNAEPKTIINEGVRLSEGGKYEEAISYYEFALKISPYIAEGWNNKGNALNMIGRYSEALECLDNALKINPQYASAWINKGISLANLGNGQEALKCFDKAIGISQNLAQAWYNKGLVLLNLGKINESLSCASSALKINPEYENARKLKEICKGRVQA